jgi:hypothetical protein
MKKVIIILQIIVIVLVITACTLPSSVDIKWTPDITIPASSDFSNLLNEYLAKYITSTDEMKIIPCDNGETMKIALLMPILGADLDTMLKDVLTTLVNQNIPGGYTIDDIPDDLWNSIPALTSDNLLFGTDNEEDILSLSLENLGNFLDGFCFNEIQARIYTSGSSIMDSLIVKIKIESIESSAEITFGGNNLSASTGLSGFVNEWETCPWVTLPVHGKDLNQNNFLLNKINKQDDLIIKYNVYLKSGSQFKKEWFNAVQIRAEMAILFPFSLIVDPDVGEADLVFPDLFSSDDLFGRSGDDNSAANIIQYLEFGIELETNPFQGAELFIKSDKGRFEIKNENKTSAISLVFDEDTMKKINDPAYIPFIPKISYHFDRDDTLLIPRVFKTKNLKFKAKILYNYNFSGNGE